MQKMQEETHRHIPQMYRTLTVRTFGNFIQLISYKNLCLNVIVNHLFWERSLSIGNRCLPVPFCWF